MCGIVGAVCERNVTPLLWEGLQRLEYRGYDSVGMAVLDERGEIHRVRRTGKLSDLAGDDALHGLEGGLGIAHTRWATHGPPSTANAHPHLSGSRVGLVHNGIIENHEWLRTLQEAWGYPFASETDSEVIAHQIHAALQQTADLLEAVRHAAADLNGAYAIAVADAEDPERLVVARCGNPLVIGLGVGENFVASDSTALLPLTRRFIYLEDGDFADITRDGVTVCDAAGNPVERPVFESQMSLDAVERGTFRHYMHKEIHEQPQAIEATLEGRLGADRVLAEAFGPDAPAVFNRIRRVQILACGTSYHAAMVARNWFEGVARIPCQVEIASEFRYRHPIPEPDALVVAISQSGETADTLAAVRQAREWGFGPSLALVNAPESSLVRETDLALLTRAGPEIGVASTKAFTTQLTALLLLTAAVGRGRGLEESQEAALVAQLRALPAACAEVLGLEEAIKEWAADFADKDHALFLGRGVQYPVAREGALKLKEISYIHAEAYAAGELKHGPLALVDETMPVVAVAPKDGLVEKLRSNLEEVRARGGGLYVLADRSLGLASGPGMRVIAVPEGGDHVLPILYSIPLQLLAYQVALLRGTDVDKPRNLAKSVTVE